MCGIFGIVGLAGGTHVEPSRFAEALEQMAHRGPQGRHVAAITNDVVLGHARLSVIDLTAHSDQPFVVDDRWWLTFNGEIFNYLELRAELEAEGVVFMTSGDTEVLLRAFIHWGPGCVTRFNGMWAFAIYDAAERTLFASRDRFGIKPFNYAVHAEQLLFASEIKSLLRYAPALAEPDYNMIANFCRTSVGAQHPQTWFREIRRLQPAHNLFVAADGAIRIERYWDYPSHRRQDVDFETAARDYGSLFEDAVRVRMRSDVPVGITLSSGVDSTSIAYEMHRIDASPHYSYTARSAASEGLTRDASIYRGSTAAVDESVVARHVAQDIGLVAEVVDTDYGNIVPDLSRIVRHLESGNSSPAVIPLMQLLARAARKLVVVMEGQGADEMLAGYVNAVFWAAQADLLRQRRFADFRTSLRVYRRTYTLRTGVMMAARTASNAFGWIGRLQQRATGLSAIYGPKLRHGYRRLADWPETPPVPGEGRLGRMLRRQHSGGLVNLLHYGDAMSMANGLESRLPFLDHRLVEYVWPLPATFKLRLGIGKAIHRQAMRGLVPDNILDEHIKHGFVTPIAQQFRKPHPDGEGPVAVLLSERCLARGLFNPDGLRRAIADHRAQHADHGPLLFRLLSTELWFREFVDKLEG